jgi:hypothetical protein
MPSAENLGLLTVSRSAPRYGRGLHDPEVLVEELPVPASDILKVELVAKALASVSTIGVACTALQQAGWNATIAGNRITVNHEVEAQLITANGTTWWQVYTSDGKPPVWIIGAQTDRANWMGCVE